MSHAGDKPIVIILPFLVTEAPKLFPFPGGISTIRVMKSLLESNPYLADPEYRRAMLRDNARPSSIIEGARGIPTQPRGPSRKRRSKASTKKSVNGS